MANTNDSESSFPLGLIGGLVVGCLLVGGAAYYWMTSAGTVAQPGEDGKEIALSFLDQVREKKWNAAWDQTGPEFRSYMGLETFKGYVAKHPALKEKAEFKGMSRKSVNGLDRVEFHFQSSKTTKKIEIVLAPDQGRFKVEHIEAD